MPDLIFFADASGDPNSPVLVTAGFLSTEPKWLTFAPLWNAALKRHDIASPLHMADFVFKERDVLKRRAFYDDVVTLLRRHTNKPIAYGVHVAEHHHIALSYTIPLLPSTPYAWCSLAACTEILRWMKRRMLSRRYIPDIVKWRLKLVFEDGDSDKGTFYDAADQFFEKRCTIGSGGKGLPPLQAADMLAWCVGRVMRQPHIPPAEPERWLIEEIRRRLPSHAIVQMNLQRVIDVCERFKAES